MFESRKAVCCWMTDTIPGEYSYMVIREIYMSLPMWVLKKAVIFGESIFFQKFPIFGFFFFFFGILYKNTEVFCREFVREIQKRGNYQGG